MNQSATSGPCGLSIADIIALAAHLRQFIADFGILSTQDIVGTLRIFGEGLTHAWRKAEGEAATCDFIDRSATELTNALRALTTPEALEGCRSIGWSAVPSMAADDDTSCLERLFDDFGLLHLRLGASKADMLDLLVWTQVVLMLPKAIGDPPDRMSSASR